MIKFIHAADIHLDSPLRGLENYEGAPVEEIRGATRKALVNLIDLALEEKVSFVIISGDMYDGDWKDYNTGLFLLRQLSKLTSNGMNVFIVKGNHDAESKITKDLKLPQGIKIFSSKQPETVSLESKGVAIHGQSFATPAVKEDLASNYPPAVKDMFNIGVLHTSVNGREGHENYAPCSIDTLKSKNYNYWALGHIHKKEILSENPWIVFPGNIQGRHIKETGFKGCMIVSIEEDSNVSVEFRNLYSLVWSFCNEGIEEEVGVDGMSEGTCDQLYLSLRLASLERYIESNEPMPLIIDDVLVNFDNDRAAVCLKIFEEISKKNQVIYFTHHKHILDLVSGLFAPDTPDTLKMHTLML